MRIHDIMSITKTKKLKKLGGVENDKLQRISRIIKSKLSG